MTYITFAVMLLLVISAMFSLGRQLKILQRNDYLLLKYSKWVYNSYVAELAISAIIYCAIIFYMNNYSDVFALVLSILLLAIRITLNILTHKKSNKKLVFTARIKRFYITAIIVLGALLFVNVLSFDNATKVINIGSRYLIENNIKREIVRTICILLSVVTPVLTVVVWLITYPIEKLIAKLCGDKSNDSDEEMV